MSRRKAWTMMAIAAVVSIAPMLVAEWYLLWHVFYGSLWAGAAVFFVGFVGTFLWSSLVVRVVWWADSGYWLPWFTRESFRRAWDYLKNGERHD